MHRGCHPYPFGIRCNRSGIGICFASCEKPWPEMAYGLNGGSQRVPTCSWGPDALLGHLCASNCARNQLLIRRHWRCWRPVFPCVCLWVYTICQIKRLITDQGQVFEPRIDILGMVIYGSEFALWLGIFICGGVFNFVPWVRKRSKIHHPNRDEPEPVSLHPMPSSTSVFRTVSGTDMVERRVRSRASWKVAGTHSITGHWLVHDLKI